MIMEKLPSLADYPARKAHTMRFTLGAPRNVRVIGDGSRALFVRSSGPEDQVSSLWMSVIEQPAHEVLLADPRELLADADDEHVPAAERARRERARQGGSGIVNYSVDDSGSRVVFTLDNRLFLTQISPDGSAAHTRALGEHSLTTAPPTPVLNPRISPDGLHVLYTTGRNLILVDIAQEEDATTREEREERRRAREAAAMHHGHRCSDDEHEGQAEPEGGDHVTVLWGTGDDDSESTVSIGLAEFVAAEEMDRYEGFWWSPDSRGIIFETFDAANEPVWHMSDPSDPLAQPLSRRYPQALTHNADVYLTLANLTFDGGGRYNGIDARRIAWDRAAYEYVAAVRWSRGTGPLLLVQNRLQTRDQVLEVDTHTGIAHVLGEHENDQWLDLIAGTPANTADGRLVCAFNDMEHDTNRLTVNGTPFTPVGWQVREVLDVTDEDVLAVVQRSPYVESGQGTGDSSAADFVADPSEASGLDVPTLWRDDPDLHDARSFDVVRFDYSGGVHAVSSEAGDWTTSRAGSGMVVSGRTMSTERTEVWHEFQPSGLRGGEGSEASRPARIRTRIENHAAAPGFTPNTTFTRLGEHRLHVALTQPSAECPYAGADHLPVLFMPYGGPGFQRVVLDQAYYWDSQWWADQGFLVVTADGRGTTGRGPKWDREVFERLKEVTLADQVEAAQALAEVAPVADLTRVAMIGWSYGGYLSALAVLEAPEVFHAACAGAPPTDWTLYDTHYTERFLGLDREVYERNSIVKDAPKLRRPLMLIHGFADDNVTVANSLRLSEALTEAGKEHTFLPLIGITHMTNDPKVARNLLIVQRDFLYRALNIEPID